MKKSEKKTDSALEVITANQDAEKLYPVGDQEEFEEGECEGLKLYRESNIEVIKIPVIAFINKDKKSELMLRELGAKSHLDIKTIAEEQDIVNKLKSEKELGNLYAIAYVPYTNDDCNADNGKLRDEIYKINGQLMDLGLNPIVYAYFGDREDAEVNAKVK